MQVVGLYDDPTLHNFLAIYESRLSLKDAPRLFFTHELICQKSLFSFQYTQHNTAIRIRLGILSLPLCKSYILQARTNHCFYAFGNIAKEHYKRQECVWELFINMHKLILIACTKKSLEDLRWMGVIVQHDMSPHHLGYIPFVRMCLT